MTPLVLIGTLIKCIYFLLFVIDYKKEFFQGQCGDKKSTGRLIDCFCSKLFDVLLVLNEKVSSNSNIATYLGLSFYMCSFEDLHICINHPRQHYQFYREKSNISSTVDETLMIPQESHSTQGRLSGTKEVTKHKGCPLRNYLNNYII